MGQPEPEKARRCCRDRPATMGGNMEPEDRPKVVLHYRDGSTVRCELNEEFEPGAAVMQVCRGEEAEEAVSLEDLKAVFFLKDPRRRRAEMELGASAEAMPAGAEARVEFFDGEIIRGKVDHYSVRDLGFFLFPTAMETNNERIFVVAGALMSLVLEG